jgi:hypothetical protein
LLLVVRNTLLLLLLAVVAVVVAAPAAVGDDSDDDDGDVGERGAPSMAPIDDAFGSGDGSDRLPFDDADRRQINTTLNHNW